MKWCQIFDIKHNQSWSLLFFDNPSVKREMNGGGGQNGQKSKYFLVRARATGGQGGQKRKTNAVARARAAKLSRPGLVTPRKGDDLRYVDGTLGHGGGTPGHGGLAVHVSQIISFAGGDQDGARKLCCSGPCHCIVLPLLPSLTTHGPSPN